MKSCPTIYEFNDKSATKGTALVRLKKLLIDTGRASEKLKVYAVGDYENDLDMLRHADVPCCPANAIDAVKKVAKLHVCHCDDGAIADVIVEAIEKSKECQGRGKTRLKEMVLPPPPTPPPLSPKPFYTYKKGAP